MPYKSEAQRRYFNTPEGKEKIGAATVNEFNQESKGMNLPEKKKANDEFIQRATDALLDVKMSQRQRRQWYIDILKVAKASENEAIKIPMIAMGFAPPEDLPQLAEILNDENDHDAIYTDLLFKAVTGNPEGAMNTIFYPTDEAPNNLLAEIKKQHEEWKEVKHLSKAIKKGLEMGDPVMAAEANIQLTELLDKLACNARLYATHDGGPGSGNFGHLGRPGKHGGSTVVKERKKKKGD